MRYKKYILWEKNRFNPHPEFYPGAIGILDYLISLLFCFNPHPEFYPGAIKKRANKGRIRNKVSILTRSFIRVLLEEIYHFLRNSLVSILTRSFIRVLCYIRLSCKVICLFQSSPGVLSGCYRVIIAPDGKI